MKSGHQHVQLRSDQFVTRAVERSEDFVSMVLPLTELLTAVRWEQNQKFFALVFHFYICLELIFNYEYLNYLGQIDELFHHDHKNLRSVGPLFTCSTKRSTWSNITLWVAAVPLSAVCTPLFGRNNSRKLSGRIYKEQQSRLITSG